MPIARLNTIGASLYGGTILPGKCEERDVAWDAQTIMEAIGSYGAGLIDMEELHTIECFALPGSGSCGKWMNEWTDARWMNEWTDGLMNRQTDN